MKNKPKIKDLAVVIMFLGVLVTLLTMTVLREPDELSYSERRRLAQLPEISAETIMNAEAMSDFNDFAVDQFVFREQFRTLKANIDMNIWLKADNNAIFTIDDHVFKTEYPLRENSIRRLCSTTNYIYEQYLQDAQGVNVKYAVVPDKNYFVRDDTRRHLIIDYDALKRIVRESTNEQIGEIELFDTLGLDCYYLTDAHWRQETLGSTVNAITQAMGTDMRFDADEYEQVSFYPFHGAYFGQSALNVKPDELIYLVSDTTKNAVVTSVEMPGKFLEVYDETQLGGMDSYNLFMHGPQAIIRAENPLNAAARELFIFRDSFSGSISPLLLPGYSAVTLVDLRYIVPELVVQVLESFIEGFEFAGNDVLFMYSAGIFNNSDSIRTPAQQEFISPFVARSAEIK